MSIDEHLRFPIGRKEPALGQDLDYPRCLATMRQFPNRLRTLVEPLSDEQLRAQYRPGSWTISQVVHHCADSHTIALMRLKRGLTEDYPTVSDYNEVGHAKLPDYQLSMKHALAQLDIIHARFITLFEHLDEQQWARRYYHSGMQRDFSSADVLKLYDWHARHHLAHVNLALKQ